MTTTTPDRCYCGALPTIHEGKLSDSDTVQIRCECGNHGALLMYRRPAQRHMTIVAACDGWYFGVRSDSRWHVNNKDE